MLWIRLCGERKRYKMIRFCDKEVKCIIKEDEEVTRSWLFAYFLNGNRDNILCVIDLNGRYRGYITYTSLLQTSNVEDSIQTNKVIMDENIWENGRKFFIHYQKFGDEIVCLPVIDRDEKLICFAYQDEEANREIRELRELMECKNALSFRDIFPEIDSVTIFECNELAYYFTEYLQSLGIFVNVSGRYWEDVSKCRRRQNEGLDYRNLNVYAEGTWEKSSDLREDLLRSVSVEFECIDKIYEKNIKEGIIQNASGAFHSLLEKMKGSKVAIIGTGWESLTSFDLLSKNGIWNVCFISSLPWDENRLIAGKPVLSEEQVCLLNDNIIMLDCCNEHSAWGCGEIDYYDYIGYRRNKSIFYIKDYLHNISFGHLDHILKGKSIILVGDILLCKRFYDYYIQQHRNIHYYNILNEDHDRLHDDTMPFVKKENIDVTDIFLIFYVEYKTEKTNYDNDRITKTTYINKLRSEGYYNYIIIPFDIPLNQIINKNKYSDSRLKPKAIILGALHGDSGTALLRQALESFDVIKLKHGLLNENLTEFCVRLSGEKSEDVMKLFWKLAKQAVGEKNIKSEFSNVAKFEKKMQELLQYVNIPSSQELFVIFHLAYEAMCGRNIMSANDYVIYWETHKVNRIITPRHSNWLSSNEIKGLVITTTRNSIVRAGGLLKYLESEHMLQRKDTYVIRTVLENPDEWNISESAWENLEIKFEDLKSVPTKVMKRIEEKLEIKSTNVLQNFAFGEKVRYIEIEKKWKPIYDNYEEYLSAYDRMRIALTTSNWQRKREYPSLCYEDYTQKELQEIFLREFRFEREIVFQNREEYLGYRMSRQKWIRQRIRKIRSEEKE